MNRVANDVQTLQRQIADEEKRLADLKKKLSEAQTAQAQTTVQTVSTTPTMAPTLAPGQVMAKAIIELGNFLKTATMSNVGEGLQGIIDKLNDAINELGLAGKTDLTPEQSELVEFRNRMQMTLDRVMKTGNPEEKKEEDEIEEARRKAASENPFAKKDKEDEDEKDEKEEKGEKEEKEPKAKKPAPFAKKDKGEEKDEKDEKEGEDKKSPFPPKKEKSEPKEDEKDSPKKEHHDEKSDVAGAKKAMGIVEKLIEKEVKDGEGGPHVEGIKKALEQIKKFLFEEKEEMSNPDLLSGGKPMDDAPALEMKDPNKMDIIVTGPAAPLPPGATNPEEPTLGLEKNLHPIPSTKPVGPAKPKLPKLDMAKDLGTSAAKMTPEAQEFVKEKMRKIHKEETKKSKEERKSPEQQVAIGLSMAREKGYDIPEKKASMDTLIRQAFKEVCAEEEAIKRWWENLNESDKNSVLQAAMDKAIQLLQKTQTIERFQDPDIVMEGEAEGFTGPAPRAKGGGYWKLKDDIRKLLLEHIMKTTPVKAFKVNDRVWTKTAGESYEIDDEPGRIVATAEGKLIVDWGNEDLSEEKPEDLVLAPETDRANEMFTNPVQEPEELTLNVGAFTPVSMEVQKTLSALSFADVMAQHVNSMSEEPSGAIHKATGKKVEVVSRGLDGTLTIKTGDVVTKVWPFELE